ncbi:MAG: hypothetical protein NDJ89_01145 [Oligoflexia bacterium]|nr:hypothetical protein [Oligoflexia bacterium]
MSNKYPPSHVIQILALQFIGLFLLVIAGSMHSPLGIAAAFTFGMLFILAAVALWLVQLLRESKEISSDLENVLKKRPL